MKLASAPGTGPDHSTVGILDGVGWADLSWTRLQWSCTGAVASKLVPVLAAIAGRTHHALHLASVLELAK